MRHRIEIIYLLLVGILASIGCRPVQEHAPSDPVTISSPSPSQESRVKVVYPNVPGSFVATAKKVKPSVVNIFTAQVVQEPSRMGLRGFENLFGRPHRERIQRSLGSGFILDSQGYIFTNYHVIRGAHEILVQLEDGREVPAVPVGADSSIDVALLHIDAPNLNPVKLGDSDLLEVGEWIVAIGNPFGLSHTVTAGIVSAKGRDWKDVGAGNHGYQNYIQTDASINPGNSGGPLANVDGEVVGMNTAVSAEGQGIGFAVPINMLKTILPQLKRSGRVIPAWIGVGIRELTDELKVITGAKQGIVITEIFKNGPADTAGLQPGDAITKFNGNSVEDIGGLAWMTNTAGVGNWVTLTAMRKGKSFDVTLMVKPKPQAFPLN